MCHTDLQQDVYHASFSHQLERVLFRASFSCEFLVLVSRVSVMGLRAVSNDGVNGLCKGKYGKLCVDSVLGDFIKKFFLQCKAAMLAWSWEW